MADAVLPPSQRLAKQRKSLKRRLGLEAGVDQLMDTDDLIKDEDLVATGSCKGQPGQPGQPGQKDAASLISDMTGASIILPWRKLQPLEVVLERCFMRRVTERMEVLISNETPCLDYAGLSARERNQLKRELKRKSSLKPSLSSKRSKTAASAAVQPLLSDLADAHTMKHHKQGLGG